MSSGIASVYFIERLTLRIWFLSVLPRLLQRSFRTGSEAVRCCVFDGSGFAALVARVTAWTIGVTVEKLEFRLIDVRDEEGRLIRLRVACQDLAEVQSDAMAEPMFCEIRDELKKSRLPTYLAKSIVTISLTDGGTLWRALLLVQISVWALHQRRIEDRDAVLFLVRRPWFQAIERYASRYCVTLIPIRPPLNLRAVVRWLLGPKGLALVRLLRHTLFRRRAWSLSAQQGLTRNAARRSNQRSGPARHPSKPRLAVEYMEHLNLAHPERHSELFFWQQSSMPGSDLLVLLRLPPDPVDETLLEKHGIATLALTRQAVTNPSVSLFTPRGQRNGRLAVGRATSAHGIDAKWLREQMSGYQTLYTYWSDLFAMENVRVYVTWYRSDATHCAIADALEDLGGVTAVYWRSYHTDSSPELTVDADIMFSYSQANAEVERRSKSIVTYHVAVGFLGDHRFSLLRERAQNVRESLRAHGAQRVLAYFDENSTDDPRWHTGHPLQRENYAFLLEKVLAEPWLGLVVKPKVPRTLRSRLGPVAELLRRAEATGRCYMYDNGVHRGADPPAAAALASDLAIHGHLCAATAGVESALAGRPTLLMDLEGWPVSPLYRLGLGQVVFTDWDALWARCVEHWSRPRGVPGFGDWSPMLDELDPFRDGRAAERVGTYLQWLLEGFKRGLGREEVMATAAERYAAIWGSDKVSEVGDA